MAVWDSAERSTQLPRSRAWLAGLLFAFDARQRRRQAVFEYTDCATCVFRLDVTTATHPLALSDGTRVRDGARVARLHFWNEQIPRMPKQGPTIGWARQMQRAIAQSLGELARYLAERPELGDVAMVWTDVPSATRAQSAQLARIMGYYGFEATLAPPRESVGDWLHRLGENILITLFILARNSAALRADTLTRVRVPIYLSRRRLDRDFLDDAVERAAPESGAMAVTP